MTSESLACLSDPGGRLAGRWRGGQKGWDCMLEARWYGHRGVFFLPGKNIHPCLPVVAWQAGGCGPDLGQLEGCASGQFSSRQSTAQPTNSPHNQEGVWHHTTFFSFLLRAISRGQWQKPPILTNADPIKKRKFGIIL